MREIKFRCWDKKNKVMKYWSSIYCLLLPLEYKESHVLMQYTGLHDKNSKEIYEGDIVTGYTSFEQPNDEIEWSKETPAIVEWHKKMCGFYPFYLNARWRCDVEEIEVIGNIYENPELIE